MIRFTQVAILETLRKLNGNGTPTSEEFHYVYDSLGKLVNATFAMTPASNFTPSGSNPWYDSNHLASSRARANYHYDAGGRLTSIAHYWDTWNSSSSSYSSEAILANQCDYETTGLNRALKTASRFYVKDSSNPANFTLERTENYGYDSALDYLTSASYGDGLSNANPTWSYDAAGNRNDATCDNLNRATSIGGVGRSYDILGNTTAKGSTSMGWDCLNRMTSLGSNSYVYRADGMRVSKTVGSTTTSYRYDGQMPIESYDGSTLTQNVLGARGIDAVISGSGSSYPIYDGHGNNVATLSKSGGGYAVSNRVSYDAWGGIRSGATSSSSRYCANLGHQADDESGLTYMRARYYEASSGRFISEDGAQDGLNWFTYSINNPIGNYDIDGNIYVPLGESNIALSLLTCWADALQMSPTLRKVAFSLLGDMEVSYSLSLALPVDHVLRNELMASLTTVTIQSCLTGNIMPASSYVSNVVGFYAGYATTISVMLFMIEGCGIDIPINLN